MIKHFALAILVVAFSVCITQTASAQHHHHRGHYGHSHRGHHGHFHGGYPGHFWGGHPAHFHSVGWGVGPAWGPAWGPGWGVPVAAVAPVYPVGGWGWRGGCGGGAVFVGW